VGSAPGCDLVLADRSVSRIHAELVPRSDGLWVRDLGSRNGTFVAGVKVESARIPPGANVRVGTTDLALGAGGAGGAPDEGGATLHARELGGMLAEDAPMREVFAAVAALATQSGSVLFLGEAGTGKNALARVLHGLTAAAGSPFVVLDCSALAGPVEAAETIEQALQNAEGGVLVLDEPAELPLSFQRELVPPLAANAFRVVATSQRDLRPLVNLGAFREALYFRLADSVVRVPPLRERPGDLAVLLRHFLGDLAPAATDALLEELARLPWMGNVRELELYAERLRESGGELHDFPEAPEPYDTVAPIDPGATLEMPALSDAEQAAALAGLSPRAPRLPPQLEPWFETGFKGFRERWIELGEREYLRRLMQRTNRSSSAASREAGLERTYLYRLLKKHGA